MQFAAVSLIEDSLRFLPLRVFSMEELGRLSTACREKAIMVGRDSFFDLSTAYLGRSCLGQHLKLNSFHRKMHCSQNLRICHSFVEVLVGTSSLIAISRAHHSEVWDETQRWNGLNRLMGRAILSNLNLVQLLRGKHMRKKTTN